MLRDRFIENHITIQDLYMLYKTYGKAHEIHAGCLATEHQDMKKPLAGTRGSNRMCLGGLIPRT